MKEAKLLSFVRTLILLFLIGNTSVLLAQNSIVTQHIATRGDRVLIRTNQSQHYTVTCYHDSHNCSSFIVNNGTTRKRFTTSDYDPSSSPLPIVGYVVKDMEILDKECWVCGEMWTETGQIIYPPNGQPYPEILHDGFIGKFNVEDVMAGSGNFEVIAMTDVDVMNAIAVYAGGATAIGGYYGQGYSVKVKELTETTVPGFYKLISDLSPVADEAFMDVAWAGGKVVVLSRFGNPSHYFYYRHYFGLRYGQATNFGATNTGVYCYDNSNLLPNTNAGRFDGLTPIFLSHTNKNNGVMVTHLGTDNLYCSTYRGQPLMYHIPHEGADTIAVKFPIDAHHHRSIKEVRNNIPCNNSSKMGMLLDDSNETSVFRFTNWGVFSHIDTILYTGSYKLMSFEQYDGCTSYFNLLTAGNYSSSKVVELSEFGITNHLPSWENRNCMHISHGKFREGIVTNSIGNFLDDPLEQTTTYTRFTNHPFLSTGVISSNICTDGINAISPFNGNEEYTE